MHNPRHCLALLLAVLLFAPSLYAQDAAGTIPTFKRVFIVVLENVEFWTMNVNPSMRDLANKGLLLTNYKATTHPSQPNYISMVAGDTMGVTSDGDYDIDGKNLVDLLEDKQISWKVYQEDYPGDCFTGSKSNLYVRKHNPFMSFNNIRLDADRCSKIVHSDQLWADIDSSALPQFMFYTPNMHNNGHDTGPVKAAQWTSSFVNSLLSKNGFADETLIVITFDEGLMIGPNMVFTLLIGPGVNPGTLDNTRYDHYSLLRSIEDNFALGSLDRNDANAVPFKFINNPPSWMLTLGALIGICVAGFVVLATVTIVTTVLLVRRCRRKRMVRVVDEPELGEKAQDGATSVEMKPRRPSTVSLMPQV